MLLPACSLQPSAWMHLHNSLLFPSNCGSSQPSTSLVLISVSRAHASTSERLHHWDIYSHTHIYLFFCCFFFCKAWMSVTTHFVVPAAKTDEVVLQTVRLSHRRSVCRNKSDVLPASRREEGGTAARNNCSGKCDWSTSVPSSSCRVFASSFQTLSAGWLSDGCEIISFEYWGKRCIGQVTLAVSAPDR